MFEENIIINLQLQYNNLHHTVQYMYTYIYIYT